eukprot:2959903-Pyramimonas_sp.AAC.1
MLVLGHPGNPRTLNYSPIKNSWKWISRSPGGYVLRGVVIEVAVVLNALRESATSTFRLMRAGVSVPLLCMALR